MEKNISFTLILNWLKSTEMFARPSKQLPGKWQLEEYYVETGDELRNITESRLKAAKELWNIEFTADKNYLHECNLPVSFISGIKNGNWNTSQNFITLKFSGISNESVEFIIPKLGTFKGVIIDGVLKGEFIDSGWKHSLPKGNSFWQ